MTNPAKFKENEDYYDTDKKIEINPVFMHNLTLVQSLKDPKLLETELLCQIIVLRVRDFRYSA